MKIKKGFELRQVGEENIIVAKGAENVDFSRIISLNEPAALLWRSIGSVDFSAEQLTATVMENYCVDVDIARNDIDNLITAWLNAGIIEE